VTRAAALRAYALGAATPFVVAGTVWSAAYATVWVRDEYREGECGVCDEVLPEAPFYRARVRWHCRRRHGLYLLLSTRVRRRQLGGLSLQYAKQKTGCTTEQWRAAANAVPNSSGSW